VRVDYAPVILAPVVLDDASSARVQRRNDSLPDGFSRYHKHSRRDAAMNWDRIEGNWKEFKGKVQQKWGKLTQDDLDVIEGKRTELSGRLQQRYGVAKDEAERDIDNWLKNVH
jgi:uncharacterized protein YjbJ (UPF0337 family)